MNSLLEEVLGPHTEEQKEPESVLELNLIEQIVQNVSSDELISANKQPYFLDFKGEKLY